MPVTVLKDQKSFEAATKNNTLSVVHFQADWAEQCVQVNQILEAMSAQKAYSNVNFYSCPAEDLNDVCIKHNIEAVPSVFLFRSAAVVDRIDGADAAKISQTIQKHTQDSGDEKSQNSDSETLEDRLKALINKSKVMLFMKGNKSGPRCGFSKQIIEILNNTGVDFDTFDILTDEEVRQGLKTYSDWPTYPQLYVNGDLIGGLDIVKEMLANGDLVSTLKG